MKKIIASMALAIACFAPAIAQDYPSSLIKLGQKPPEIELADPAGNMQKLSEIYKGRVVLLDFWASWCGPCRRANPEVVALYNKYKDAKFPKAKKGFTVVSVSLDQNKQAWVDAIASDGLVWPYHMSDLGQWKSKVVPLYGITGIPQSFLIGPDGKVIAKYGMGANIEADIEKMVKKKG